MRRFIELAVVSVWLVSGVLYADEPLGLDKELKVFEPLVGKSFQGEFANSTADNPMHDVSRWERALNGRAVRVLHSVNEGMYGGETLIMWDAKVGKLTFWYFTTAGFTTTGTFSVDGKKWSSLEKVTGNANGITEVKATTEITGDSEFHVKAEYFRDGQPVSGREIRYKEAPGAQVIFK